MDMLPLEEEMDLARQRHGDIRMEVLVTNGEDELGTGSVQHAEIMWRGGTPYFQMVVVMNEPVTVQ